jgi:hypothetical protein
LYKAFPKNEEIGGGGGRRDICFCVKMTYFQLLFFDILRHLTSLTKTFDSHLINRPISCYILLIEVLNNKSLTYYTLMCFRRYPDPPPDADDDLKKRKNAYQVC